MNWNQYSRFPYSLEQRNSFKNLFVIALRSLSSFYLPNIADHKILENYTL